MERRNTQGLTSFSIDKDILESKEFQEAKKKKGFLKQFCNNALRDAFVKKLEVNEHKEEIGVFDNSQPIG